jgi:hypothetical protein
MTTKDQAKPKCCASVWPSGGLRGHPCGRTAKVERDGKWYCGIHDPVAQAKRNVARHERGRWESDRRDLVYKKQAAAAEIVAQVMNCTEAHGLPPAVEAARVKLADLRSQMAEHMKAAPVR